MYEDKWEDILCHIALGNFYFTQIGELIGEENVEQALAEMEREGLVSFIEVKVIITDKGLKRIQGKLASFLEHN